MQESQNRSVGRFALVLFVISLFTLIGFGVMVDDRLGAYGAWGSASARDSVTVVIRGDDGGVVTSTPPGINCGQGRSPCSFKFARPADVTLNVVTAQGFRFDGFDGDCRGSACQMAVRTDRSVIAAFTRMFQLKVASSGAGTVRDDTRAIECGQTCAAAYPRNKRITLRATATLGSAFTGWEGDCSGTGECSLRFDSDKTVSAAFVP